MESFGQYLRRERELRNISLEEISEVTKINRSSLQAIEEDKFDLLPGKLFIRGFIRAYCRHIGLDEHDVILRFQTYWEESCKPDVQPERRKFPSRRVSSLIVILILFLGVSLMFWLKETERESTVPIMEEKMVSEKVKEEQIPQAFEVPEISPPKITTEIPSITVPSKTEPSEIVYGKSQDTPPQNQEAEENKSTMVLEARASEETWIKIEVDGQPPKEITLRPGESITWKAALGYSLTIGNAGGVELLLDGKKLEPLGPSGKVVVLNLP